MLRLRPVLVAALLAATPPGLAGCGGSSSTYSNDSCPAKGSPAFYAEPATNTTPGVGQQVPQMPHSHVPQGTHVDYNHDPPTSGCHYITGLGGSNPAPMTPGVYSKQVDAPFWVHNLEHGYIIVLYNCPGGPSGCPNDFQKLREWYQVQRPAPGEAGGRYAKVLVLPWSFDHRFAAVSWDWYDSMDTLDLSELARFRANHVDQSPEGNNSA